MKLTQKHLDYFQKRCEYWLNKFGLDNWRVSYAWNDNDKRDIAACIDARLEGYNATIFLTRDWTGFVSEPTNDKLDGSAKHEVLHLLLARTRTYAIRRYVTPDEIYEAEEELVEKLNKIIK